MVKSETILVLNAPIIVTPHLPQVPGYTWGLVGIQELFDKLPNPGDDFMLQIPYIL